MSSSEQKPPNPTASARPENSTAPQVIEKGTSSKHEGDVESRDKACRSLKFGVEGGFLRLLLLCVDKTSYCIPYCGQGACSSSDVMVASSSTGQSRSGSRSRSGSGDGSPKAQTYEPYKP